MTKLSFIKKIYTDTEQFIQHACNEIIYSEPQASRM